MPFYFPPAEPYTPPAYSGALVNKTVLQDIPTANTWTTLTWDAELFDTDAWHDNATNPSRLTVPAGIARVRVGFGIETDAVAAVNVFLRLLKNGLIFDGGGGFGGNSGFTNAAPSFHSPALLVTPGDYFEAQVFLDAAGRDVLAAYRTWFSVEAVGRT